jgi:hypothetical protein
VKIVPRRGFVADGCAPVTVTRPLRRSPGRTGASQRISSTPGEPIDAESRRTGDRRVGIDVKGLRVVAPSELEHLLLGHVDRVELRQLADLEVLPVPHREGTYRG